MPKKTKLISIKCIACTEYKDCTLYDKWGCPAVEYARSVLDGKDRDGKEIITCRWVKLACERFVDDLKRGEKRGLYFNPSEKPGGAAFAIDFFSHLKLWKGREYRGNEFVLAPHYQFVISNLMGWKKLEDRTRRFGTGYVEMARKGAKALALDTPVPTPDGWTTIGDIDGGDILFDENGKQCRVICTTSTLYNEECYEVVFSDGTKIIADKGHLWETKTTKTRACDCWAKRTQRKTKASAQTLTTEEMHKTLKDIQGYNNHSINNASPLNLKPKELSVDPYVLGIWLSDGVVNLGEISQGEENIDFIRGQVIKGGYEVTKLSNPDKFGTIGLATNLRKIGVLSRKHIPKDYLRASTGQRLSLLQGLLDGDGSVPYRGTDKVALENINKELCFNIYELVASLGMAIRLTELKRKTVKNNIVYRLEFLPTMPVFRMPRKLALLKPRTQRTRRFNRYITNIEKVNSVPVKCVSVSSDSKLFLVSKSFIPTHNSTVAGGLGAYFFVADKEYGAEIYTAAVKEKQAKIVWENIYNLLKDSMFSEGVDFYKQNMSIESTLSKCEFVVGDPKGLDGLDTHFCSLDELHAHPTPEIHDLIVDSTGTRPQPMILIITTAGFDQTGVCYQRREYLTQILKKTIIDDSFFGIIYTLDTKKDWPGLASITSKSKTKTKEDDWRDEDVWVKAMPGLWGITKNDQRCGVDDNGDQIPGYMTRLGKVRDIALYAASNPAALNNFLTKRMNIWTQQVNRFIDLQLWDSNYTSDVYVMEQ